MAYQNTRRMVGAFIGQMILIACLIAFDDFLPSWVPKLTGAAALLLPVAAYLTIVAQPGVYHAWQTALRETYEFGSSSFAALRESIGLKSVFRAWRFVTTLKAFPSTGDDRFALLLFPFKLYVLIAMPFLWLSCLAFRFVEPRFVHLRFPEGTSAISEGYVLCLSMLLFGALGQALFSQRGRSTQTVFTLVVGILFFWMLWPWGTIGR
jgi:hypothetical protein